MSPQQISNHTVHELPLRDDGSPELPGEPAYIYLPPPTHPAYSIRFKIDGTSSICREGSLWVNIPPKGTNFDRKKFYEFKLKPSFTKEIRIDVPVHCAGAFEFYSTFTPLPKFTTGHVDPPKPTRTPTHYIDVAPRLHVDKSPLPLDAISCISVLSKFMGKYPDDFLRHLHGISERAYNMVHFTPLMMRGDSNSPYSIYDQHTFDKNIFKNGEADIADLIGKMEHEYGLLSLTDVVWNHTANNSKWLEEHPESGYNIKTAPHLRAPYELDSAFLMFSSKLKSLGLPTHLTSADDLLRIMDAAKIHVIGAIKLWEFYVCDADKSSQAAVAAWMEGDVKFDGEIPDGLTNWSLKEKADWIRNNCCPGTDRMGERFRRNPVPQRAAALLTHLFGKYNKNQNNSADERTAYGTMHRFLNEMNLDWYKEYDADVAAIIEQVYNRCKYVRLDDHGPKISDITLESPLIESYFTRLPVNETTSKHDPDSLALANNGWVWAADVMKDNAGPKSKVYLRRELIVWGDCVKLRYGSGPDDSPFLWKFMAEYTQLMAKHFHGFRIDNCHSTPLAVASYMLDCARLVRPDLVVAAELFSGDEKMDFLYCQKLGICFLIREAMQCWSTAEMSRLVHINCGRPIGSFEVDDVSSVDKSTANGSLTNGSTPQGREIVHKIIPSKIHALLMDCTHDNETPVQRRDGRDTLPTSALVAMCAAAAGSVFGMDELYPQLIELVHETRPYTSPYSNLSPDQSMKIGPSEGTGGVKRLLNQLHTIMGKDKYDETFVHHDGEYVTVHRIHPKSRKGYYLIAHTAYPGYGNGNAGFGPQRLTGTKAKLLGAWSLECDQSWEAKQAAINDKVLRGIPSRTKDVRGVAVDSQGDDTVITVPSNFPPGSIVLCETWIPGAEHSEGLDKYLTSGAREAFKDCNLNDINAIMYRADSEEHAMSNGADGAYAIPGSGPLVYCGLQGWWSVFREIVSHNDLGHPICNHLREGQWALDYIVNRLDKLAARQDGIYKHLHAPADWLRSRFDACRSMPSFLLPRCFALVVRTAKKAATDRAIEQMHPNIQHGQRFVKSLAMVSCQVQGYMDNAKLWPDKLDPSLAAGLPHFTQDWARVWGRDTMIAMRGLLTCTGRYDEAKEHLLCFGSLIKHGMIPNLLNSGKLPRYNSRDSVWFFLQNIQDYISLSPQGQLFLKENVRRRFLPYDDTWFAWDDSRAYSKSSSIEDIIHECLQRHAGGMHFREYNAGPELDSQMKSEGFQIDIEVNWKNGFIYGGNEWNCGTWMDKMGDSVRAGNKGHPGTSRDGAPVEITGLQYSAIKWVADLNAAGKFKYDGVQTKDGKHVTYAQWAKLIRDNFEHYYYIPVNQDEWSKYDINPAIVNRRGIYKDVHGGKKEYRDYQLRPNYPIAMCVAGDLFNDAHALAALEVADTYLRGPTGMATLDPSDLEYHPNYINSEDSDNYQTCHGRNYHQGPEWLWPTGFFLRALLKYDLKRRKTHEEQVEAFQQVTQRLKGCRQMIHDSPWRGLTELTNKDGAFCGDSCPTQAWSAGCILDLYDDASKYGEDPEA
ncbi:Glycogen debranching enzyme [Fulvia fulva]|uniref:Glycogen debranching enzyme n=1 Tax=Passalora fulva TaxID=5499 RepID=A0A9Q8LGC1_PASFU|nr:Glycogen debranching enzyme [Fulvia fulva]KAK4615811.1 Glycogen debranching enzyme [Fulvia fulva]KAK4617353.1 Glycogen debranching enzyme [Fulvia fulva]UJO16674.1 Glycogen debranching enzyme [Fulvia fulva]WPV19465.1 Glycogen debranching enzyme [Fulvia fulva]WPV33714.1 Glycogen debranching enzyme [Fulvia fulva]